MKELKEKLNQVIDKQIEQVNKKGFNVDSQTNHGVLDITTTAKLEL